MRELDIHYLRINRNQMSNTTDYFNELMAQFTLDCGPEDIKEVPEAKKCLRHLKSLGRRVTIINIMEKQLFGV